MIGDNDEVETIPLDPDQGQEKDGGVADEKEDEVGCWRWQPLLLFSW